VHVEAAFNQVLVMMLIMLLGLTVRRVKALSDELIKGLNRLLLLSAQPAMVIVVTQYQFSPETLPNYLLVVGISFAAMVGTMGLFYVLGRKTPRQARAVMCTAAALSNVGFMGIPVAQAAMGDGAVFYLSAYIVGLNLSQWIVGCAVYDGFHVKTLKNMLNPIIIALAVGLTLYFAQIRLPGVLMDGLNQLSNLNTPMSMLILGARLAAVRPKDLVDKRMWGTVGYRLIGQPLIILLLLSRLNLDPMVVSVLVLGSAMPCGANVQLQAELYGGDIDLSARCISVSSLLSAATIPLMLSLRNML